jgi:hypothetical protein
LLLWRECPLFDILPILEFVAMWRTLLLFAPSALLMGTAALAAEGDSAATGAAAASADIARLVEQLDAPDFSTRQAASQKLAEAGQLALPQLERAVAAPVREVSRRALDVLKLHLERGDAELKQSAKESLTRLAGGGNPLVAQRASHVLHPPRDIAFGNLIGPGVRGQPAFNNFPLPVPATRTLIISDINGKREVEVKDDAHSIKMQTWPTGRIEIDIQDRNNGQPPKKLNAKDLDELKTKDAEVARLYESYQQPRARGMGFPLPAAPRAEATNRPALR